MTTTAYATIPTDEHTNTNTASGITSAATSPSPPLPAYDEVGGRISGTEKPKRPAQPDDSIDGRIAPTTTATPIATDAAAAAAPSLFASLLSAFGPSTSSSSSSSPSADAMSAAPGGAAAPSGSLLGLDQAEVHGFLTKLKSRKWVATLRPAPMFLGQQAFSRPRNTAEAVARLEANLPYFLTNYLAICLLVTTITLLSRPSLIFVGALLGALWLWASRQEPLQLGSLALAGRTKMLALTSVTGVVLFVTCGTTLFFLIGVCACLVLGHAMLHNLPPLEEGDEAEMAEFMQESQA